MFSCVCVSCSTNTQKVQSDSLELAIGHLIKYQTDSKISLSYGTHSPLREVFRTYYSQIATLPKKDKALFLFMVDNNLNVSGGADLFDFYNPVYLCCEVEYIKLLEENINNPYFNTAMLNEKLGVIKTSGDRIAKSASFSGQSVAEYLKELEDFYLSEN